MLVDVIIIEDNPDLRRQSMSIIDMISTIIIDGRTISLRPHGIDPIGESSSIDYNKIFNEIAQSKPGVALIDLRLKPGDHPDDVSGIDLSLMVKSRYPECSIILVSSYLNDDFSQRIADLDIFRFRIDRSKKENYRGELTKIIKNVITTHVNSISYRMYRFSHSVNNGNSFMWALTIGPNRNDVALDKNIVIPYLYSNSILVETIEIGICGTDKNCLGQKPSPSFDIIDFHEAFGRVAWVGEGVVNVKPGDLVIPMVRRCEAWEEPPWGSTIDQDQFIFYPCSNKTMKDCYHHADQCPCGEYLGKKGGKRIGYKSRGTGKCHGFGSQYFYDSEDWLIKITPSEEELFEKMYKRYILTEPLSIVWKAHREIINHYSINEFNDEVLIIGIGPIGLLTLVVMKALHPGLKYTVIDLAKNDNRRVRLVSDYYPDVNHYRAKSEDLPPKEITSSKYQIIIEATGQPENIFQYVTQNRMLASGGILMLIGVTEETKEINLKAQAFTQFVKGGNILLGSINSSRADFENSIAFMKKVIGNRDSLLDQIVTRWPIHDKLGEKIIKKLGKIHPKDRDEIKVVLTCPPENVT